jgi:hypothetical protein
MHRGGQRAPALPGRVHGEELRRFRRHGEQLRLGLEGKPGGDGLPPPLTPSSRLNRSCGLSSGPQMSSAGAGWPARCQPKSPEIGSATPVSGIPVVGGWNGNGYAAIGVYRPPGTPFNNTTEASGSSEKWKPDRLDVARYGICQPRLRLTWPGVA